MSLHGSNNRYLMIGTQDNATPSARGNFNAWWNLQGGDGGFSGYDPTNNGRHLSSAQGGRFYRYDGFVDNTGDELDQVPAGPFLTPMVYAGNGTPYAGSNALYRWDGDNWIGVTGNLSTITTLERSKNFGSKLFVGRNDGRVYRTSNLGPNIQQVGVFTGVVADIDESPLVNDRILVAVQNGPQSTLQYCTNSAIGTPIWSSLRGTGPNSLPQTTINAVCFDPFDPGTFYVGTDVGLFITTDFGARWYNMNPLGLPNVQVNAIEVDPTKSFLYVATFGRGVWRVPIRPLRLQSVAFTATAVFGGSGADCVFTLSDAAPPGGVTIATQVSPNIIAPTAPVVVPATQRSVTVRFATRAVTTTTIEGVHGTLNEVTQTGLIVLHPLPRLSNYTITPRWVFGGDGFEGNVILNSTTPLDVWVLVQSDPSLINHAKFVRVRAGQSNATFFASTQSVGTTTDTSSTASFGGGSATQNLTIYPVPSFQALALSPSRVYGGNPVTGTLHLSSPAPIEFFFGVASDSPSVTPPTAGYVASKAAASAPFTLTTNRRIADTVVTITASYLNRTVSQTLTVMAYPLLTVFTVDKATLFAGGSTIGRLGLNVKVRHPGLDILVASDSPMITVPAKVPVPIGDSLTAFDVLAGQPTKAELVTLTAQLDGKAKVATITVLP